VQTRAAGPGKEGYAPRERGAVIVLGLALAAVGVCLWIWPVHHRQAAPASAKCTDAATCWVEVDAAPEILLSALVVLGAVLALVGINNVRLTKFTGPGGIGFETSAPQAANQAAPKVADQLQPQGVEAETIAGVQQLAADRASHLALRQELALGRRLTDPEVERVAESAATDTVETVRALV
jgi:hypothetical protein